MKISDNHYLYRLETQNEDGSVVDFQEVETIEPLRSVGDIHDELDLENNKQIKRIEEIVFTGDSSEYWYSDNVHTTETHFVAYMESTDLYCHPEHHLCETDRSLFEFGDVHVDENKNFFCTSVESNGVNRIYISIAKSELAYTVYSHETLKEFFKDNPITVWYVLRYPVEIPRIHAKGYVITHDGSTTIDVQPQTMGKVTPIVKTTIEDTVIEMDSVPTMTINNTDEGSQITDLTFEGVTLVNNAKADNVKGTKEVSHTRYDFTPFCDGQTTINNTVEGGYVSAKLYGDTMINIAKTYGETDLLTATDDSTITDLLGDNTDGVIVADGTITEGRLYGNSEVIDETILSVKNPTIIINNGAELSSSVTLPYELNKLPNGVADYIDVVNGVYVQRVGVLHCGELIDSGAWRLYSETALDDGTPGVICYYPFSVMSNKPKTSSVSSGLSDKLIPQTGLTNHLGVYDASDMILVTLLNLPNNSVNGFNQWMVENNPILLYELATPIYTPLTDEEKALLPLTVYAQGNIMMSSNELKPSKFEFRAKSNNRMQLDMLETGHYYLNAPSGNVKLGDVDIDVTEMPCIINVGNNSNRGMVIRNYINLEITNDDLEIFGYRLTGDNTDNIVESSDMAITKHLLIGDVKDINIMFNHDKDYDNANVYVSFYNENKQLVGQKWIGTNNTELKVSYKDVKYVRLSYAYKIINKITLKTNITLSKLPSHRIPTTFTQGMKSSVDFGYWEGSKEANCSALAPKTSGGTYGTQIVMPKHTDGLGIRLNRIEGSYSGQTVVVEDEFDVSTGKFTKRIEKYVIDGSQNVYIIQQNNEYVQCSVKTNIQAKMQLTDNYGVVFTSNTKFRVGHDLNDEHIYFGYYTLYVILKNNRIGTITNEGIKEYFTNNPMTIYYELATPKTTYYDLSTNSLSTMANTTFIETWKNTGHLFVQCKPAPLSYLATLSPNTQYTVFHNRKNYNGSVKTPMINLGGTEVSATGSRTVVTTPSTLAHNELQFIGGENTVEQVMVLHGDWTKEGKTVDYFEGLQSSIIGDKTLENLVDEPVVIWSGNVTNTSNGGVANYIPINDIVANYSNRPKLPEVQVDTNVRSYGMTLQNLAVEHECIAEPNAFIRTAVYDGVLPIGTYIFFYNVIEPNPTTQGSGGQRFTPYYTCQDGSTYYEGWETHNQTTGLKYWKFTVTSPITMFRFWIANINASCSANNFMLLQYQQGMENWSIPFFEGMKSVENPIYHSVGKNLFDLEYWGEKIIPLLEYNYNISGNSISGTINGRYYLEMDYNNGVEFLERNTQYAFSCESSNCTTTILFFDAYSSELFAEYSINDRNNNTCTFTTPNKPYRAIFRFGRRSTAEGSFDFTTTNIQLEQGTQATEYEPYKENILSTPQGTVLRGVGSYKDVIGWNDGIVRRNCVEFTITGEEGYNILSITENTNTIMCSISWKILGLENKVPANDNVNIVICDKLPTNSGSKDAPHIRQDGSKPYSGSLIFWFDKTKFSTYTSQGINDYIKSIGGLTIVAPLADTQYEDVEFTGGGNWDKIVLDETKDYIYNASVSSTTNGLSIFHLQNLQAVQGETRNIFSDKLQVINDSIPFSCRKYVDGSQLVFVLPTELAGITNTSVKQYLQENPITVWYQTISTVQTNTDPLVFNHGTLYTTTDTHPSTFLDFSLQTTNRYIVKDFDKLKYTVLTEQPFYLNGVDYPASSTGMTIVDVTGIADTSIYSDDTMITVVQDDGSYYADGVLTQFKGEKTFVKEFIRTGNGTYNTGMTLLEPLELCSGVTGSRDIYNPITGTLVKKFHTFVIDDEFLDKYAWNYQEDTANNMCEIYLPNTVSRGILPQGKGGGSNGYVTPPFHYNTGGNIERICMTTNIYIRTYIGNVPNKDVNSFLEYLKQYTPITVSYELETPQIIQATPTSTYISTRPENGNIVAEDTQIHAEYLNYDNEQSIISPRMLGEGDEIRWEQGSQCYVYENAKEYIPLTDHDELFGANIQAQEYVQYVESVDGADIELGIPLKEKAVYQQSYVAYEDNIVYPTTRENLDETNGVEVDYICGATWQNPDDLSDIRHLGELREDGQYDVTIRRSGDDEIRLMEGTTHISLDYDVLPPSEFELTFFNDGGVEVGKYGDTTHVLEDCVENSKLESGTVYGLTLINISDPIKSNGNVVGTYWSIATASKIKPKTRYLCWIKNLANDTFDYYLNDNIFDKSYGFSIGYNETKVKIMTTKETPGSIWLSVSASNKATEPQNLQVMLIEYVEGLEEFDLPYFEGIGSTTINGFSSCGKNLWNGDRDIVLETGCLFNQPISIKAGSYWFLGKPNIVYDNTPHIAFKNTKTGYSVGIPINFWRATEVKEDCDDLAIYCNGWDFSASNGKYQIIKDFMISAENLTEYEPYKSINYTLPTPIELRSVGDVCDTFDVTTSELTQRVGDVILNGSENWILSAEKSLTNVFYMHIDEAMPYGAVQCDKLKYSDGTDSEVVNLTSFLYIGILKTKAPTVADLKEYLRSNPITVYYQLKTESVKIINLIPSTTQTTQEPTFILPQPLRSVPNGICDRLYWDENKGHYCIEQRVTSYLFDETYPHARYRDSTSVVVTHTSASHDFSKATNLRTQDILSNTLLAHDDHLDDTVGFSHNGEKYFYFRLPKEDGVEYTVESIVNWFKNNPTTVYYSMSKPQIIDLPHLDKKVELPTQPNVYPIGYKAAHEKVNPQLGLTLPYKQLNMPAQPINLDFKMDIADYVLTWDDVKEARLYNIILNDEVIATTKQPYWNSGEEMYGYILVEAQNEIGDSVSKELYIKTVPNAPAQLTVAHNPVTDHYDFEISFIDKSTIADYYTVQYRVDGGEWIINNIPNDQLSIGEKQLWSFSVYEINESIEVWATATNDVGTNDILPSAIYYMSPTPQWTYRINSKDVFLRWIDESPYDTKYKLRYSYLSNGQYQYAYFEGDKQEIGKLYEAVVPLAEDDEVTIALCIVSEKENLYCKPVKASKEKDPNIVPPLNFNYRWLARGLIEFYWQDQYDVDIEYEYILETMKGSESIWTQINEVITSTDVEGTGTIYRVEYQLEDLEQIRMKVRMRWAMNETQWTETLTTVFIPVEGNPPTYIRRTQTAEGLLVEWEAQAYIDSYHIYVIDNETKEVLQHLETQDNSIIVDLDYNNSIEVAIYEISRFSGGIESDPTDAMVFTPTMSEITMLQNIYQPCVEEHSIEVSTVQRGSKQPYVIHDISYTPNVESEGELQVNVSTPFLISYHPTEIDVHQVGSKTIADMDLRIKTLDTRTEETVEVMTFERITDTYDMNFQVYTPSVMSYPITLDVSKVRIVCLGDSLTSGHPFYWAETGTGDITASYPYQLSRRLKNQYEVINSGYGSDTTDRCLARFERDVLTYHPQYCLFQCGTNDKI